MDPRAYPSGLLPAAGWRVPSLLGFVRALAEVDAEPDEVMFVKATQALCHERLRLDGEWSVTFEPLRNAEAAHSRVLVAERRGDLPAGAGGNVTLVAPLAHDFRPASGFRDVEAPAGRALRSIPTSPIPENTNVASGPGAVAVAIEAIELLLDDALLELHGDVTLLVLPYALGADSTAAAEDPATGVFQKSSDGSARMDRRDAIVEFIARRVPPSDAILLLTPPESPETIHAYNAGRPSVRHWTPASLAARTSVIAQSLGLPLACQSSEQASPIPASSSLMIEGLAPLPSGDPATAGLDLASLARRVAFLAGLVAALTHG